MRCTSLRKSIFTSTTFWSIILLLCQAVGPSVDKAITRGSLTLADVWAIFQACVTALVGAIARYNIGDVYTPKGIPGADPPSRQPGPSQDVRHRAPGVDSVTYNQSHYEMDDHLSDDDQSSRNRTRYFRLTDGTERTEHRR